MKQIAIGIDDFRKIRAGNYLYVDKTHFIREVLDGGEVLLLPRPRRFGKTLNMTMLQAFFDHQADSRALFEGLAITADAKVMSHLNAFPTVFVTLKSVGSDTWENAQVLMKELITDLFRSHRPTLKQLVLDEEEQAFIKKVYDPNSSLASLASALKRLTEWLFRATGKEVILLVDEYDTPIHRGHANGYYPQVVSFMRSFLGEALKGNPYLERAVITGILRIAKESIYSGLNNLSVYSVLSREFSTCFGFTEAEVAQLLLDAGSPHPLAEVQAWYNGYRFGREIIYNPWSILNMLKSGDSSLSVYWINTSNNTLIADLVKQRSALKVDDLEALLRGEVQNHKIQEAVAMSEIDRDSVWGLLLFSGYLTAESWDSATRTAALRLPNLEVRSFFEDTIISWLGPSDQVASMVDALLDLNLEGFATLLAQSIDTILSYHDLGPKTKEKTYHVLMVGLLASLNGRYEVLSNRESGRGRYDLALMPHKRDQPGFIFEFKQANAKTLKATAQAALDQIRDRDYATTMRQAGVTQIVAIGLAFYGKQVAVSGSIQDSTLNQNSEPQHYLVGEEEPPTLPQQQKSRKTKPRDLATKEQNKRQTETDTPSLATEIQMLQHQNGLPIATLDLLLTLNQEALKKMLQTLNSGPR